MRCLGPSGEHDLFIDKNNFKVVCANDCDGEFTYVDYIKWLENGNDIIKQEGDGGGSFITTDNSNVFTPTYGLGETKKFKKLEDFQKLLKKQHTIPETMEGRPRIESAPHRDRSKLVRRQVPIKTKSGIVWGTRWVKIGSKSTPEKHKKGKELFGEKIKDDKNIDYKGGIITLIPPQNIKDKLYLEGGEEKDNMHVTLAFIPYPWNSNVVELVSNFSMPPSIGKLTGKLEKFGAKENDEKAAVVATLIIPGLDEWRKAIIPVMEEKRLIVSNDFPVFIPHITLEYINKEDELPQKEIPEEEFEFDRLEVWDKDKKTVIKDFTKDVENGVLTNKEDALDYIQEKYLQKSEVKIEEDRGFKHKHDGFPEHPIGVIYHQDYFSNDNNNIESNQKRLDEIEYGTELVKIILTDSFSDPDSMREEIIKGKVKDGFYEGGDGFIYKVENKNVFLVSGLRSKFDFDTGKFIIKRKKIPKSIFTTPIFHRTELPLKLEELHIGSSYGRSGANKYKAIYFDTNPSGPFGRFLIEAKISPNAKVVHRKDAPNSTEEALKQGIDVVLDCKEKDGEWDNIAVLNPKVLISSKTEENIEKQFTPKNFNPIRTLTSAFRHENSGKLAQHTHEEHPQNHPDGNMIFPLHPVSVEHHQDWFNKRQQGKETGEVQDRGDLFKPSKFEINRRFTLYQQLIIDDFSKDIFNGDHYKNIINGGPPASHLLKISKIEISKDYWLDNDKEVPIELRGRVNSITGLFNPDDNRIKLSRNADSFDLIHEIGHSLLDGTIGRQTKDRYFNRLESIYNYCIQTDSGFPTDYARNDEHEFFAECYASFITENKHFQKRNRQMYDFMYQFFDYFRDADDIFLSTGIKKSEDDKKIFVDPKGVGIFNPNLPDLIENEEKIENQNLQPPRQGLVPQTGDWQHPYRWVLPEEQDKVGQKEENIKPEEPKKKPADISLIVSEKSEKEIDDEIKMFSENNWDFEIITKIFSSNIPEIDIKITNTENYLNTEFEIDLDIYDNLTNKPIGNMRRLFHRQLDDDGIKRIVVDHEHFSIYKSYQGKGIASKLLDNMEEEYKHNGVYGIELEANSDIGGYAWALQGYDFANKLNLTKMKSYFIRTLRQKLAKNVINQITFDKWSKEVEGFNHSWEFASWNPTKSQWGKHIGKNWMLGTSWHGEKILNDNDEGFRIGKLYRERKNAGT